MGGIIFKKGKNTLKFSLVYRDGCKYEQNVPRKPFFFLCTSVSPSIFTFSFFSAPPFFSSRSRKNQVEVSTRKWNNDTGSNELNHKKLSLCGKALFPISGFYIKGVEPLKKFSSYLFFQSSLFRFFVFF